MELEDDYIPLSALQHFVYCPRQCALIHVERLWRENRLTVEGRHLHEKPDSGKQTHESGLRIARGIQLKSDSLRVYGRADVVEFRAGAPPLPVEYKRGRPKSIDADEVQLCAQAICLEEMLGVSVPDGAIYYGRVRRRHEVRFSEALRENCREVTRHCRKMIMSLQVPLAEYAAWKCNRCSLIELCMPRIVASVRTQRSLRRAIQSSLSETIDFPP